MNIRINIEQVEASWLVVTDYYEDDGTTTTKANIWQDETGVVQEIERILIPKAIAVEQKAP